MRRASTAIVVLLACSTLWPVARPSVALAGKAPKMRVESFELLSQGVAAFNRGDFAEAVDKLTRASSIALNSFRAHYYLGLALNASREYRGALGALGVALDLDPKHLQALVALGDAHLKLGDVDEAQAAFYRAMKERPAHAPALDGLARSYEAQAKDDEAIDHYRRALLSNKGFAPAYTHLGDLFLRLNRLQEAVRLLEEAISVRPNYAPGMNRLALAYGRLGLEGEAVATIQGAIELEPRNPAHRATLGRLQLEQGFLEGAERAFDEALELGPGLPEPLAGLAEVARRRGRYDEALARIDTALADERLDASTALGLRSFRASLEQEREAFAALESRTAGGEPAPEDLAGLASIYASRGLWDLAADLEQQVPTSAEQQERLGYALFQAGRFREAQTVYAALAERTSDTASKLNHGVTLSMLGDEAGAMRAYEQVLEAEPEHRQARLYLGNALLRADRRQAAAQTYREFLDLGEQGEEAERVRRILKQIAPGLLPDEAALLPEAPPAPPEKEADQDDLP